MDFEWNPEKAEHNFIKHKVSFQEAATVLGDSLGITIYDPDHSETEDRFITVGWSNQNRLLMVAHAERGDIIRIISARKLTSKERKDYERENKK